MALHGRPRSKGRRTATALGCVVAVLAVCGAAYQLGMDDAQRPRLQSLATPGQPTQLPALRFPAVPAVETSAQVLGPVQTVPSLRRAALRAAVTPAVSAPVLGPHVGLVVHDPTHGKQLLNLNGSDAFVPASTTKLFTVAAALAAIDPTTRFRTMVVSAGGSRRIVLTGGGDPLLARRTPPAGPTVDGYPQPATLARLAAATAHALDRRGVSSVRVGLDAALFAGAKVQARCGDLVAPDRLFEDVDGPILGEAAEHVLRPLEHEVPPQMREAHDGHGLRGPDVGHRGDGCGIGRSQTGRTVGQVRTLLSEIRHKHLTRT